LYKLTPILDHLNAKFRNVYTPEWKVYIPSKHAGFDIKSFELCEAISGYVFNFIIYIGQDAIFDKSLKNEPHGSKAVLQVMAPLLNQGYRSCATKKPLL
jgi:hypothetical protein